MEMDVGLHANKSYSEDLLKNLHFGEIESVGQELKTPEFY